MKDFAVQAYNRHGHVYCASGRYVHLHVYVDSWRDAEHVARILQGRARPHQNIYVVLVTKRAALAHAARYLLASLELDPLKRQDLIHAKDYAEATTSAIRVKLAQQLKASVP